MDNQTNNWKEFTLGNPQEEPPKRIEKKQGKRRILWLIAAIVAAMGVVAAALLFDRSSFDGLRRNIIYAAADKDESGCATLYHYVGNATSCFTLLEGSLVDLTANELLLLNEKGEEIVNEQLHFASPALVWNEQRVVAYDIGGQSLYVLGEKGILWSLEEEEDILSVTVNENNYVTVTGSKSGYKSAVRVYDAEGKLVFEFQSADHFAMTAALSRDNRTLLAVTMGQENSRFTSYAVFYRVSATKEQATVPLGDLIYDVGWADGAFCLVGENGLYFLSDDAEQVGSYAFNGDYLRRCDMRGNGYVSVLLGRYRAGTQSRLIAVDARGSELGCCDVDGEVLSMSSAGRYTAVLCSDALSVFNKEMQAVAMLQDISEAQQVLMRADGSAVLAGNDAARLYLP